MEEDHDFSEFEQVKTIYRRSLLPWWVWVILCMYLLFTTIFLLSDIYSLVKGHVFAFDMVHINVLVPYPHYVFLSVLLYILMLLSALLLWFEKREAAAISLGCFGIMLMCCVAVMVKGLLMGHFFLRVEVVVFIDIIVRLLEKRKEWKHKATSRYSI